MDPVDLVVACARLVYAELGTGHSESVYHRAMEVELRARGIRFETKVIVPISYRGFNVGYGEADLVVYPLEVPEDGYRMVDGVVAELKATTYAPRSQEHAQIRSYLRSRGTYRGVLVNFRQPTASTPSPESVDWEQVWLEDSLPTEQEGIASAAPHAKEDSEADDGQQHEPKGECG